MGLRVEAVRAGRTPVPCCGVGERLTISAACLAAAATLAACSSGDSTVSKTPLPSTSNVPAPTEAAAPPPPPAPPGPDPCAVDLAAPTIAKAVSELPRDPRSKRGWKAEPVAGNFNECAQLSAVIIKADTDEPNPNTRAVMFHLGKYIPTGVPDTYGFNGIDATQSTGDTVALTFAGGMGLQSVVKFRWNGNGVELIGNTR